MGLKYKPIPNVRFQSFLNYMEFRTNHEPHMVHGKCQIKSEAQMSKMFWILEFDIS